MPKNKRQQLEQWTTVVADTGDLTAIKALKPEDTTTNPSLLLAVANNENGRELLTRALQLAGAYQPENVDANILCDAFTAIVGTELLQLVPGLVSTEVDARESFDTRATIERARNLINIYRFFGADTSRVLIKIAATWEGIQAAKVLEAEGIRCNLTLIFHPLQAVAAAQAQAFLISPFVGRIFDWYQKRDQALTSDPGVEAVTHIYQRLKGMGSNTVIMGASFRTVEQIEALAGCDRLTISPALLEELAAQNTPLERQLQPNNIEASTEEIVDEITFRYELNQCPMSSDLLADGIRRFVVDQQKLAALLEQHRCDALQDAEF
ncbi:MAG TPA: transaldolase family protein [Alcanivoracaceae bacterium]|nr:transaldolase family protein [Alcanivoracaceae bacterium]